jgi:hypothetical protein
MATRDAPIALTLVAPGWFGSRPTVLIHFATQPAAWCVRRYCTGERGVGTIRVTTLCSLSRQAGTRGAIFVFQ